MIYMTYKNHKRPVWEIYMSSPGVKPGLSRPQRDVRTTRRWGLLSIPSPLDVRPDTEEGLTMARIAASS